MQHSTDPLPSVLLASNWFHLPLPAAGEVHRGVCESPKGFGVNALQNCLPNSNLQTVVFLPKRVVLGAPLWAWRQEAQAAPSSIWWLSAGLNLSSPPSHFHPVFLHHSWEHPPHTRFLAAQPPKSNCSKQQKPMGIHLPLPTPLTSLPSDQFLDPPHSLE